MLNKGFWMGRLCRVIAMKKIWGRTILLCLFRKTNREQKWKIKKMI